MPHGLALEHQKGNHSSIMYKFPNWVSIKTIRQQAPLCRWLVQGLCESEEGELLDELDASTCEEHSIKVIGAVMLDGDVLGVASASAETHQNAFYGLFKVMSGWTEGPLMPNRSRIEAEKLSASTVSEGDLYSGEYCIAYHYIITYANFFK